MGEPEENLHPRQTVQAAVVGREVLTQPAELVDLIRTGGPHEDQADQPADPQLESPGVRHLDPQVLGADPKQLLGLLMFAHLEQGRRPPEPRADTVELDDRAQHLIVAEREQVLGAVVHLVPELPQAEALIGSAGADEAAAPTQGIALVVKDDNGPAGIRKVPDDVAVAQGEFSPEAQACGEDPRLAQRFGPVDQGADRRCGVVGEVDEGVDGQRVQQGCGGLGPAGPLRLGQSTRDLHSRRDDVGKLDCFNEVVGSVQRGAPDRIRRQADRLHFEPRHSADHPLIAREVWAS